MEANQVEIKEQVSASKKLQAEDARELVRKATRVVTMKGKKIVEFKGGKNASDDAVTAMLGTTGNLRAPTAVVGKTLLVGFNEDAYSEVLV